MGSPTIALSFTVLELFDVE